MVSHQQISPQLIPARITWMTVKTFLTHLLPPVSVFMIAWVIYTVVLMTYFDRFVCFFVRHIVCLLPVFVPRFHCGSTCSQSVLLTFLSVLEVHFVFIWFLSASLVCSSSTSCNCLWAHISTHSYIVRMRYAMSIITLQKLKKYSVGPFKHFALVYVNYAVLLLQYQQVICDQITVRFFIPHRKC